MSLKMIQRSLVAGTLLVTLMSGSAMVIAADPNAPVEMKSPSYVVLEQDGDNYTLEGVLDYRDLEGGYYAVGDWSLMGDEATFKPLLGKTVIVKGTEFKGMSIRMVKSLEVTRISEKDGMARTGDSKVEPVAEPVEKADEKMVLEGKVEFKDLEGGFYAVDGIGLIGDDALFKSLLGQQVIVRGKEFTGISIRMVRQVEVESIARPLAAERALPEGVAVAGKKVGFDQAPVVTDGVLMMPVRAVAEAAGGTVAWNAKEQMVTVTLSDRVAHFWIGKGEAELNENGVMYFRQNLIAMKMAPVIQNGRTLISADALTMILGMVEQADADRSLDLTPAK